MLKSVVKKEWLLLKRDGRSVWFITLVVGLLLAALASGVINTRLIQKEHAEVSSSERARWENQGDKNPHSAAHYGTYVFKKPLALAAIDPGVSLYQGNAVRLEAHKRSDELFRQAQDSIAMGRLGQLNAAFILQSLLPLLIILLGFSLISAERAQGCWKQLMMLGVNNTKLLLGKGLFLAALVLLMMVPIALYSFFYQGFTRAFLFALSYFGYLMIWVGLTLLVSSLCKSPRQSLIWLLVVWSVFCLVLPKMVINSANSRFPVESGFTFNAKLESLVYTPERELAMARYKLDTLEKYGVKHVDELPFNWDGALIQYSEKYGDAITEPLFEARAEQFQSQYAYYQNAAIFNPFIAIQTLSMSIAATDFQHHWLFVKKAEQHRQMMQKTLNDDLKDHRNDSENPYQAGKALWQKVTPFSFSYPKVTESLATSRVSWLALLGWGGLLLVANFWAIKRLARRAN